MELSRPSSTESAGQTAPVGQRFFRRLAWFIFVAALTLIVGLGVAPVFCGGGAVSGTMTVLGTVLFLLVIQRSGPGTWRRLGLGYGGIAAVLAYLALDDGSIRHPMTLEEFAPSFPGAEKSFEVLMRYGREHPLGRDFQFTTPVKFQRGAGMWQPQAPQWRDWITANRPELEDDWAKLEPVRNWWTELNRFDRISDLTPSRNDAEIIAFQPIRTVVQHACAIASLQAIDGQGDAAFATLLPILEVGRKLEPSSRTLVRSMVGRIVQRMVLETAGFVLDTTSVSPAARTRFAAALGSGNSGETAARRLLAIEYVWAENVLLDRPMGNIVAVEFKDYAWASRAINPVSRFVYNSHRTINLYGDLTAELQDLAAKREVDELESRLNRFLQEEGRPHFKNFGGSLIMASDIPSYSKVIENYWKTEDLRAALHARLQT